MLNCPSQPPNHPVLPFPVSPPRLPFFPLKTLPQHSGPHFLTCHFREDWRPSLSLNKDPRVVYIGLTPGGLFGVSQIEHNRTLVPGADGGINPDIESSVTVTSERTTPLPFHLNCQSKHYPQGRETPLSTFIDVLGALNKLLIHCKDRKFRAIRPAPRREKKWACQEPHTHWCMNTTLEAGVVTLTISGLGVSRPSGYQSS